MFIYKKKKKIILIQIFIIFVALCHIIVDICIYQLYSIHVHIFIFCCCLQQYLVHFGHVQTASNKDFIHIFIFFFVFFFLNVIPSIFLQMRLSLDALAAQIGFKTVFCVTFDATQNDNVKTGDRNAGSIHTVFKRYVQRFLHFPVRQFCTRTQQELLFGERDDASPFFLHPFWKPCHIHGYAYVHTKAIHAYRLVMSGHKSYLITCK